jgi:hypothetical protein
LLARLFSKGPKAKYPWVLKGGYAMELRIRSARTTKDIDLTPYDGTRLSKNSKERREEIRGMLQEAPRTTSKTTLRSSSGKRGKNWAGHRKAAAAIPWKPGWTDGNSRFHVDVGIGDEVLEPLDVVEGQDWLAFGTSRRRPFRRSPANSNSRRNSSRFLCPAGSARIHERKI